MTEYDDKRAFVANMYPGDGWKRRVAFMSDAQVFAIWTKEQEKLAKQEEAQKPKETQDDIPF
jgi:hypothetical protein